MTVTRLLALVVLAALAAGSLLSLVMGTEFVGTRLPGGLPLGNALAALVFVAGAGVACVLSPHGTRVALVSRILLLAALAWLPVSIAMAGNLDLNFSGDRGTIWLTTSLILLLAIIGASAWAAGAAWRRWARSRRI